ncbi:MAG: AAA family ATPase, partial [Hyphomicrobiales bacterium]|nr:AAA family ATPase [Hyphomicrobiales bacterium]
MPLYNQYSNSDAEFLDEFVARYDVLETLVRRLQNGGEQSSKPHQVLIGSRGMGKTSLLRRLAIEIENKPELKKCYIPLTFREEQYNVLSLSDFWRNCGESLAEWAEKNDMAELADYLDAAIEEEDWRNDDLAGERLDAELAKLGRTAVLLIDNIDLILDALPANSHWMLRRHLQSKGGPIAIGAATQPIKSSSSQGEAFYEFFLPHHLEPLGLKETENCMRKLAGRRAQHGKHVLRIINKQNARLRTLHTLTGGNPRVIALIYRLLESAETNEVMADLDVLLDELTPYYKAKIEEYSSPQQRAIVDAIALNWDPITSGELAKITRIKNTTLSPQLIKLRKSGLIENVEMSGAYAGHQIVERFFNIWYLMRHGTRRNKQKMRWLVGFLTGFYSTKELRELAARSEKVYKVHQLHPDYALAFELALSGESFGYQENRKEFPPGTDAQLAHSSHSTDAVESTESHFIDIFDLFNDGKYQKYLSELENLPESLEELEIKAPSIDVANLIRRKGVALEKSGDIDAALAAYDAVIGRYGENEAAGVREQAAWAMFNKGYALKENGDIDAALTAYDALIARYGDDEAAGVREQAASAMFNKGYALKEN